MDPMGRSHQCDVCETQFKCDKEFLEHAWSLAHQIKYSSKVKNATFLCILCKKVFSSTKYYGKHISGSAHKQARDAFRNAAAKGKNMSQMIQEKIILKPAFNVFRLDKKGDANGPASCDSKKGNLSSVSRTPCKNAQQPSSSSSASNSSRHVPDPMPMKFDNPEEQFGQDGFGGPYRQYDTMNYPREQQSWYWNDVPYQFPGVQGYWQNHYNDTTGWSNYSWGNQHQFNSDPNQYNHGFYNNWQQGNGFRPPNPYHNSSFNGQPYSDSTQNVELHVPPLPPLPPPPPPPPPPPSPPGTGRSEPFASEGTNISRPCTKTAWRNESHEKNANESGERIENSSATETAKCKRISSGDSRVDESKKEPGNCSKPDVAKTASPETQDAPKSAVLTPTTSRKKQCGASENSPMTADGKIKLLSPPPPSGNTGLQKDDERSDEAKSELNKEALARLVNLTSCTRKEKLLLEQYVRNHQTVRNKYSCGDSNRTALVEEVSVSELRNAVSTILEQGEVNENGIPGITSSSLPEHLLDQISELLGESLKELPNATDDCSRERGAATCPIEISEDENKHRREETNKTPTIISTPVTSEKVFPRLFPLREKSTSPEATEWEGDHQVYSIRKHFTLMNAKFKQFGERKGVKSYFTQTSKKLLQTASPKRNKNSYLATNTRKEISPRFPKEKPSLKEIDQRKEQANSLFDENAETMEDSTPPYEPSTNTNDIITTKPVVDTTEEIHMGHARISLPQNDSSDVPGLAASGMKNSSHLPRDDVPSPRLPDVPHEGSRRGEKEEDLTETLGVDIRKVKQEPEEAPTEVHEDFGSLDPLGNASGFSPPNHLSIAPAAASSEPCGLQQAFDEMFQSQLDAIDTQMNYLRRAYLHMQEQRRDVEMRRQRMRHVLSSSSAVLHHVEGIRHVISNIPRFTNPSQTDQLPAMGFSGDDLENPLPVMVLENTLPVTEAGRENSTLSTGCLSDTNQHSKRHKKSKAAKKKQKTSENTSLEGPSLIKTTLFLTPSHLSSVIQLKLHKKFLYTCSSNGIVVRFRAKFHNTKKNIESDCVYDRLHQSGVLVMDVVDTETRTIVVVVHCDGSMSQFDANSGKLVFSGTLAAPEPASCCTIRWAVVFLATTLGAVYRFHLTNLKMLEFYQCCPVSIACIATAVEGAYKLLCVGGKDGSFTIREAQSGLLLRAFELEQDVPVELQVAFGSVYTRGTNKGRNTTIYIHKLLTCEKQTKIMVAAELACMHVTSENFRLVVGGVDGLIHLIDLQSKKLLNMYYGVGDTKITSVLCFNQWLISGSVEGNMGVTTFSNKRSYLCKYASCQQKFAYHEDAVHHIKKVHAVGTPKVCVTDGCDFIFAYDTEDKEKMLVDHILTHVVHRYN